MSVVGVARPIGQARGGEQGESGRKDYTLTYLVRTDSPYDGPEVVLGAFGLPAMRDAYPIHPTAIVIGRYPRPISGTYLVWHVEILYSTHSVDRDQNPLNTRPEIEWGYETFDEPLPGTARPGAAYPPPDGDNDSSDTSGTTKFVQLGNRYGSGILNAAGDPFDPPPTRPNYYPVVRFSRNEASFDPVKGITYGNTVNANGWNGLAPRQVWLKPIEASHECQLADGLDAPDILYWRVRYTFVLKAETWDLALLNIGPNYLDVANTSTSPYPRKFRFIRDGHPVMDLLKADGTKYSTTEVKKPNWIIKQVMRAIDFSPLSININLNLSDLRRRRI